MFTANLTNLTNFQNFINLTNNPLLQTFRTICFLLHHQPAIHTQHRTGDEGGEVAGEE